MGAAVTVSCPLAAAAREWPHRRALVHGGSEWTFLEMDARTEAVCGWLAHRGVGKGASVAVLSWNRPEVIELFWATLRLGARLVPLNVRLADAELRELSRRTAPAVFLADSENAARLPGSEQLEAIPASGLAAVPSRAEIDPSAIAAALFTSGTTGTPKRVQLTHLNFAASVRASAANLGTRPDDAWLGVLPLFHVGGLVMAYRCAADGACLFLERSFDAGRAAALLAGGQISLASLVPTALARVLEAAPGRFPSSLRALLIGGGPMGAALLSRARAAGLPVLQTYGLTEACSQVTTERLGEADGTTAGPPLDGLAVVIRAADGTALPAGAIGEIHVEGPTLSPDVGGTLATGDLGSLDARGRLVPWARRTDLIVTGGENVSAAEVEQALAAHPLVRDVAVVPVDDERWGQVPVAVVVRAPGLEAQALLEFARERLAGFKVPRSVLWASEVPRNANGKLERARARALALRELGRSSPKA